MTQQDFAKNLRLQAIRARDDYIRLCHELMLVENKITKTERYIALLNDFFKEHGEEPVKRDG